MGEPVPETALVHWAYSGSVTQSCSGADVTVSWNAGDPVDMAHLDMGGIYGPCGRPVGTHRLVNPSHPDTADLIDRYIDTMAATGVTGVRIDEFVAYWHGVVDGDFQEYPTRAAYLDAWADRLKDVRTQAPWEITCPSIHGFWSDDFRDAAAAGGCVSAEDFPSGRTLIPNLQWLTVAEARAAYIPFFLWGDFPGQPDSAVPNNINLGAIYTTTMRTGNAAAGAINLGWEHDKPNLVFLFYCSLVSGGTAFQREFGRSGDRIYCNDSNKMRGPTTGLLPPWYD